MIKPIAKIGRAAPNEEVVAELEMLLARAQDGELRSLVYAGELSGGSYLTGHHTDDVLIAVGLIEAAKHNLLSCQREASQ